MKYKVSGRSHAGHVLVTNEDAWASVRLEGDCRLLAVADGMGSARGARLAARSVVQSLERNCEGWTPQSAESSLDWIHMALGKAHKRLVKKASEDPDLCDMATTVQVALLTPEYVIHQYAGDSRLYWLRGQEVLYRSRDHSDRGELNSVEAARLYSFLGPSLNWSRVTLDPDPCKPLHPQPGDWLLLCSDGLTSEVSDADIVQICQERNSPNEVADALLEAALLEGGRDNITVLVALATAPE